MTTVTVELTEREARALASTGKLWSEVLAAASDRLIGRAERPVLATGAEKLERALIAAGAEAC